MWYECTGTCRDRTSYLIDNLTEFENLPNYPDKTSNPDQQKFFFKKKSFFVCGQGNVHNSQYVWLSAKTGLAKRSE